MTQELLESLAQWGLAGALAVFLVVRLAKSNNELGKIIAKKDDQLLAVMEDHDRKREDGQKERLEYEREANSRMTTVITENTQAVHGLKDSITELRVHMNGGRR